MRIYPPRPFRRTRLALAHFLIVRVIDKLDPDATVTHFENDPCWMRQLRPDTHRTFTC